MIKFDFKSFAKEYNSEKDYDLLIKQYTNEFLTNGQMSGWYQLDKTYIEDIKATSLEIRKKADVFVVIGIGGSYLGAKAIIDALSPHFSTKRPEIVFAGTNLSSDYLSELTNYLKDKDVVVNVISKSGNTIEPNVSFDQIYELLLQKYSEEDLKERIIVTTDEHEGYLLEFAKNLGCKRFIVPNDIGGRFSVLTPVGLLPIAVASIDIDKLIDGAYQCRKELNDSLEYTKLRDLYYHAHKYIESFVVYDERLIYFTEWLKQLFAESQGKNGLGILPTSMMYTRDLHSMGQYLQDGLDIVFETHIYVDNQPEVYNKRYHHLISDIEKKALLSVCEAHYQSDVPSNIITLDKLNEENMGYLIFFFFYSAMMGSYLLGVNYYDQPGVNGYKDILKEKMEDNL